MTLSTSTVQPNEVVKAEDWDYGLTAQVQNIGVALASVLESRQSFVVGGKVTPYAGGGLNLSIAPIFGVVNDTMNNFLDTDKIEPVPVSPSPGDSRIDVLEVQGTWEEYDLQQRAFMDFETDVQTFQDINTKKRHKVSVRVKAGNPGSVSAPVVSDGWVKLAEIHVPADAVEITADNIRNITADVAGMDNAGWTNEKKATYNMGFISDVNSRFRAGHNEDGTHKANAIDSASLAIGIASGEVNGAIVPTGKPVDVSGQNLGATTNIADTIQAVARQVTSLWDKYLKNGAFQLNGEVAISDVVGDAGLTKAIKVGAAGDGTGYIKLADKVILSFTADGTLRASSGYNAINQLDFVTKAVTDGIGETIIRLRQEFERFASSIGISVEYSNTLLSRYKRDTTEIQAISTTNLVLHGTQIVDTIPVEAGYVVFLKDQINQAENGLWEVQTGTWNRIPTLNFAETYRYKYFTTQNGTNTGKVFYCPSDLTVYTPDLTPLVFIEAGVAIAPIKNTVVLRDNTGRISDFEQLRKEFLLAVHPVGTYYWSSNPTDPGILFGGTWIRVKNRFVWAIGDEEEAGVSGGSKTVTLAVENLPSHTHGLNEHTHSFSATTGNNGSHRHHLVDFGYRIPQSSDKPANNSVSVIHGDRSVEDTTYAGDHTHAVSGTTGSASGNTTAIGSGKAFSNMPPYAGAYCWRRVS